MIRRCYQQKTQDVILPCPSGQVVATAHNKTAVCHTMMNERARDEYVKPITHPVMNKVG